MNAIYITPEDLKKEIGHGTDGAVYKYNSKYYVKLYHAYVRDILTQEKTSLEETKIYQKNSSTIHLVSEPLTYYSYKEEEIRVRPKEAIYLAMKRQENVHRNYLPQAPVYLNHRFAGCLLRKVSGISIHKLMGLPQNLKRKIMYEVLLDIEELLQNNIYPVDLANSPYANTIGFEKGHSHILVNPINLHTHIIDLDGKSTIYTEKRNEEHYTHTLNTLNILFLEFFYHLSYDDYETEDELLSNLEELKIPSTYQKDLVNGTLSIPKIKELIKEK